MGSVAASIGVMRLTAEERNRYVHWWIHCSGLTRQQLREIATGMWSDRLEDGNPRGMGAKRAR